MQEIKRTLLEMVVVIVVGLAFGLAANAAYKDGLSLTRDYFPRGIADDGGGVDATAQRLRGEGLTPISFADAVATFEDPLYEAEVYIFVDARDDKHYTDGHIPGALQLDHYHIEKYIDEVLPACEAAEKVVVYCNGGECEDSEFATLALRDEFDVAPEKLYVFVGGIEEWTRNKQPVEVGMRFSGEFRSGIDE